MVKVQRVNGRLVRLDPQQSVIQQRITQQRELEKQKQILKKQELNQKQRDSYNQIISKLNTWNATVNRALEESNNDPKGVLRDRVIGRQVAINKIIEQINVPGADFNKILAKADNLRLEETAKARGKRFKSIKKKQEQQIKTFKPVESTNKELYISRVPVGGGKREYLINGKWQSSKIKSVKIPEFQKQEVKKNNEFATVVLTDTKKNIKTTTRINLDSGEIISTKKVDLPKQIKKIDLPQPDFFGVGVETKISSLDAGGQKAVNKFAKEIVELDKNNLLEDSKSVTLKKFDGILNKKTSVDRLKEYEKQLEPGAFKASVRLVLVFPALIEVGSEAISSLTSIPDVVRNPSLFFNGLKQSPGSIKETVVGFSQGDPKATAQILFSVASSKISLPRLNQIKVPNVRNALTNLKNNLKVEVDLSESKIKTSKDLGDKKAAEKFTEVKKDKQNKIKDIDSGNYKKQNWNPSSAEIARYSKRLEKKNKAALKKLFENDNKDLINSITVKKGLPSTDQEIIKLAEKAFATSGETFSKFKKRVRKETGKNLVRRKDSFILLEPKTQLKKGKATGKKSKPKEIKIISKKEVKEVTLPDKKLSLKELDKLEKQIARDVTNYRKSKSRFNKKGSLQIQKGGRKFFSRQKKTFNNAKQDFRDLQRYVNNKVTQFRNKNRQLESKGNKQVNFSKDIRKQFNTRRKKVIEDIKLKNKTNIKFIRILALLSSVDLDTKKALASLSKQSQELKLDLKDLLKQVNEFKDPIFKDISIGKPGKGKVSTKPKRIRQIKRIPQFRKDDIKRLPKKPKTFKPGKPRKLPKLKLPKDYKPENINLAFDIKFRERKNTRKPAGKQNPVIVKTVKLGLPLNRAIAKGFGAVDKTTQASAELVISGITKSKDYPNSRVSKLVNKFTVTRSKKKDKLKFVEKNKNRIDTTGEKKGLALSRALKPKKKKVNKKKKR